MSPRKNSGDKPPKPYRPPHLDMVPQVELKGNAVDRERKEWAAKNAGRRALADYDEE